MSTVLPYPYGLVNLSEPAVEPLTAAELRDHLRIDDSSEDDLLEAYITAAREYVETFTGRAFINRSVQLTLECLPSTLEILLPRSPVSAVSTFDYVDTAGDSQSFSDYQLITKTEPARIMPSYGNTWPSVRNGYEAVTIEFTAGYGTASSDVPERFRQVIRMLAGNWYENREATDPAKLNPVPFGVDRVLWTLKVPEFS